MKPAVPIGAPRTFVGAAGGFSAGSTGKRSVIRRFGAPAEESAGGAVTGAAAVTGGATLDGTVAGATITDGVGAGALVTGRVRGAGIGLGGGGSNRMIVGAEISSAGDEKTGKRRTLRMAMNAAANIAMVARRATPPLCRSGVSVSLDHARYRPCASRVFRASR